MKSKLAILVLLYFTNWSWGQHQLKVMDQVVFYDMYDTVVKESPAGCLRLKNERIARKLTDSEIKSLGDDLKMDVTISAHCDNYDRLSNVFIAFVPKGSNTYTEKQVQRIEIARFITPFMNRHLQPSARTYSFDVNQLIALFNNTAMTAKYDFWVELQIAGVPYAAQKEIKGCAGLTDTYEGTIVFSSTKSSSTNNKKLELIPITTYHLLNNYEADATDTIGKTVKSYSFEVPKTMKNATVYVITSNHGANEGGEEYVRRWHYVTLDGSDLLSYKPGGKSCEPYRQYNTQGNGIYGKQVMSEEEWTSWNNWCPGDAIPTREIQLSTLAKGKHTITLSVPEAEFVEKEGYFPVSMFVVGEID